jgi:hypothetical protein
MDQAKSLRYKEFKDLDYQKELFIRDQNIFVDLMRPTLLKISRQRRRETRQVLLLLESESEMSPVSTDNKNNGDIYDNGTKTEGNILKHSASRRKSMLLPEKYHQSEGSIYHSNITSGLQSSGLRSQSTAVF